ncbi:acyl carrier protein [Amycolatopsis minnesotensis]|uniref:Carrier domain-containing protein n=1 Tax=Amycolatopsis minnesotensis TaxID=337894 RepID=A0ABN2R663_9PSEU
MTSTTLPTREQVTDIARALLAAELKIGEAEIAGPSVLRELPGADSIHLLRVVSQLERQWDTEFDDDDIFSSRTLDELVDLVLSYLEKKD